MVRDLELMQKILYMLEKRDMIIVSNAGMKIDDYEPKAVRYHLNLLADAGLVVCEGYPGRYYRLTNEGHTFLETIGDDTLLKRGTDGAKTVIATAFKIALEQGVAFALAYLRTTMGFP